MELINQTGLGLYLVLLFGLAALTVAVRQVMAPETNRVLTVSWLLALTGLAGLLGTIAGVQQSARQFGAHTEIWLFLQDLHHSLNDLVAACILIVMTMLVFFYAHIRRAQQQTNQSQAWPLP